MLAVGARLAPVDRAGLVVDALAIERHMLAVALHRELLQIRRKALEVLLVGQHGDGRRVEEIAVPDRQQPISTGMLRSSGAVRKCSSIAWKPASIARKCSAPIAIMVERPIAESIE